MEKKKSKSTARFQFTEEKKGGLIDLSIITIVISAVVLIAYMMNGIYPFGDASIARGDMVQQTIPSEMYYVWDILHGKASPFFTWNSALGMNISGATSLGALLSPLNLFLYFSTRDNLVYFVNIFMILKMISIAFAMYFYLKKYDVKNRIPVIGGILYAFGAASLVHFQIMLVMDVAFLLPLIMIGVDRIFSKKGCKFFLFMLALCMIVNVYTGGMILIFLFLTCGMRLFFDVKEKEEKRRCALWLGVSVAVALLLSAVVTIPALISVAESSRSGDGDLLNIYTTVLQSKWSANEWKTVERMVINIALPCAAILFFFLFGKKKRKEMIKSQRSRIFVLGLMFVSVLVSGIELLWHGGSRACWPVRFVFIISFALIDLAVSMYEANKDCMESVTDSGRKRIYIWIAGGVAAFFSGWVFYKIYDIYTQSDSFAQLQDGFLCILLEILFIGVYLCVLKSKVKGIALIFLCVEMTCTSIISFAPNKDNVSVFSAEYLEAANNVAKSLDTELEDFERIKNMDYKVDHIEYSLVLGEEAISNYWHVLSPSLQPAFSALGYSINWTQLLDTGGTIFTDTLFQMKYSLSQRELSDELYDYCQDVDYDEEETMGLYKNKFELPFAINTDISELTFSGEKFATQNSLFAAVTGSNEQLIEDVSAMVNNDYWGMEVGNEKKLLYFYGTNTSDNPISISVNGNPVTIPSSSSTENQQYPADFGNGLIFLGCFQNEQVIVQFFGGSVSDIHLGLLDYTTFVNGIELVKNQNPKITSLKQGKSSVTLELEQVSKENIFLPISYDDGWNCKVNGEKVTVNNMDGMLLIPVESGKNRIELKYVAPGQKTGAVISLCALLVLAAFILATRKKVLKSEKAEEVAGYAAYVVFAVLYYAFLILLFVIPVLYYLWSIFIGSV